MAEWCGRFPRGFIMEIQARKDNGGSIYSTENTWVENESLPVRQTQNQVWLWVHWAQWSDRKMSLALKYFTFAPPLVYQHAGRLKRNLFLKKQPKKTQLFFLSKKPFLLMFTVFFFFLFYITTFFWQSSPQGKWSLVSWETVTVQ